MNESKLKTAAMDSVGELPDLLLMDGGYPHLPMIKKADQKPRYIRVARSHDLCCGCAGDKDESICKALPKCADYDGDDNLIQSYIFEVQP